MKKIIFLLIVIFTVNNSNAQNSNQIKLLEEFYINKAAKIIANFAHPSHKPKLNLTQISINANKIVLTISFKGKLVDFKTNYILVINENGIPTSISVSNEGCVNPSFYTCETIRKTTVKYLQDIEIKKNKELYIDRPVERLTCKDMCLIELWAKWINKYQQAYNSY